MNKVDREGDCEIYDVIVVGAGVQGSSTAFNIARKGHTRSLLLEQFQIGHTHGSSHGGSRIIRSSYDVQHYAEMMPEAFKLWKEIEQEAGVQLYYNTGGTFFGHPDSAIKSIICHFQQLDLPHEVLSAKEANSRYEFLNLPNDFICVVDKSAGILAADKAVEVLQLLFIKNGGKIMDNCKVAAIHPGSIITLKTDKEDLKAKKIVLTAGPWTSNLLEPLGLKLPLFPKLCDVYYWQADHPELCTIGSSCRQMGVFSQSLKKNISCYGLPTFEHPGLIKICPHRNNDFDPDCEDRETCPGLLKEVKNFIETYLQGISSTPSVKECCTVTMTPDEDFILDHHPKHQNIIIGAGFSGHGFKLAPVVGKILAELTLDLPSFHNLQPFKISRLL